MIKKHIGTDLPLTLTMTENHEAVDLSKVSNLAVNVRRKDSFDITSIQTFTISGNKINFQWSSTESKFIGFHNIIVTYDHANASSETGTYHYKKDFVKAFLIVASDDEEDVTDTNLEGDVTVFAKDGDSAYLSWRSVYGTSSSTEADFVAWLTTHNTNVNEYNVSALYPTGGVSGGNTYTISSAISCMRYNISDAIKVGGCTLVFMNLQNKVERWHFTGTTVAEFTDSGKWEMVDKNVVDKIDGALVDSYRRFKIGIEHRINNSGINASDGDLRGYDNTVETLVFRVEDMSRVFINYISFGANSNYLKFAFYGDTLSASTFIEGGPVQDGDDYTDFIDVPDNATFLGVTTRKDTENSVIVLDVSSDAVSKLYQYDEKELQPIFKVDRCWIESKSGNEGNILVIQNSSCALFFNVTDLKKVHLNLKHVGDATHDYYDYAFYNTLSSVTPTSLTDLRSSLIYGNLSAAEGIDGLVSIPSNAMMMGVSINNVSETYSIKSAVKKLLVDKICEINETIGDVDKLKTKTTEISQSADSANEGLLNITKYDMLPLGVMDNLIIRDFVQTGIFWDFVDHVSELVGFSYLYSGSVKYGVNLQYMCNDSPSIITHISGFLKLKMDATTYYIIRKSDGGTCNFDNSVKIGDELYQNNLYGSSAHYIGKVVNKFGGYIIIALAKIQNFTHLWCYSDSNYSVPKEIIVDTEHSALFNGVYDENDYDVYRHYYSRPEKNHSNLVGRTAIYFGDSLAKWSHYLVYNYGLRLYGFSSGGYRMGNDGSGKNWLCADAYIQNFNANRPDNVDLIINCTGANGNVSVIPTAEDIAFCYNNKRWFGDTSATNPWDNLDEATKVNKFGSEVCYITAFYALSRLYPAATAVICETYRTPGGGNAKYTDGKWTSVEDFASVILQGNMIEKNQTLEKIANYMGAVFVKNNVRPGKLNAPATIGDGVHPNANGSEDWARCIFNFINFDYGT